jgi:uncharacterized protein
MHARSGPRGLAVTLLATLAFAACESGQEGVQFIRVASGPAGGAWYPVGAKIAQVLEQEIPEISTSSMPGGSETNIMDVNRGNAELAFAYGTAAFDAIRGVGQFPEPQENVLHFATLYPAALQTAVPRASSIQSYGDLGDKNISPGMAGWSGTGIVQEILGAYGITFESVREAGGVIHHVDFADSGALMKDRHIDAFMAVAGVPLASIIDLNFQPGIRLLPLERDKVDQILDYNPALIEMVIPRDAYQGLTEDVPTVGVATTLVVHKDLPDELVYRMAKVFWESHAQFLEIAPSWEGVRLEDALLAVAIPVHPGAQRFYDEVGVTARAR